MAVHTDHSSTLLRLPAVIARVGLRRASIYLRMRDGTFPRSISLGSRAVAWDSRDIDAWIADRVRATGRAR